MTAPVQVSIVIGSVEAARSIRDCVASVTHSCAGLNAEIIVVDGSGDGTAATVRMYFPHVQLVQLPPGTLTPVLWSTGISRARGDRIAFTTGQCVVPQEWIHSLSSALDRGASGAGGPIDLREGASIVDRAVYLLRYSAFLPGATTGMSRVEEIAGDNAMYTRAALHEHRSALTEGFWEVELHERLRVTGRHLLMIEDATVAFGRSFPLGVISRHRYGHGRHFGAWRVGRGASPLRLVLAAPLVPFVLVARIKRRVRRSGRHRASFILASVVILWLATCWAIGEAWGAIAGRSSSANRD